MLTDLDCALYSYNCYWKPEVFDDWFSGQDTDGACFGIKRLDDGSHLIAFEGSHDLEDWLNNFDIAADMDAELGMVPRGMLVGVRLALAKLIPLLPKDKPVMVTGHSRGASQAVYAGALLVLAGYKVEVVAFAPSFTGTDKLAAILKDTPVRLYRNGEDVVPTVPHGFKHPAPLIPILGAPTPFDPEFDMKFHHIQLYVVGVALRERGFNA